MKRLLILLGLFVSICTLTTSALAEMSLYGSARMSTFYTMEDEDKSVTGEDDVDFNEWLQTNARVGANVTTGDVKGRFEYGTKNDVADVRLLYGTWDFEQGTLLVGKDYSLIDSHMISNVSYMDDALFLSIGLPYAGRTPQIRVTMGDLSIAALKPCNTDTVGLKSANGTLDVDTYSPKIEVAYNIAMDSVKAALFGGFNTYKVGFTATGDTQQKDYEIYSGIAGARCMVTIDDAYVNGTLFYAMNGGNYGLSLEGAAKTAELSIDGDVEDSSSLGGALIAGSKIDDMLAVEGGIGYVQNDVDSAKDPDATMAVYAQLRYTPVKEVCIVPEIGYVDYMDDAAGETQGSKYYAGAKWQINF